jgi:hypothetical protein
MAKLSLARLVWVGPLTVAIAVLAVLVVQAITVRALSPMPRFSQAVLSSSEPAVLTAVGVTAGVIVFAFCAALASNPANRFRQIALIALVLSAVPNVIAGIAMRPAVDWPSMLALYLMHVVAWAVTVSVLAWLSGGEPD